ncbi:MAG: exodeoxyribonuclease VII large subunit [Alphaproteobacteria bacterium]
MVDASLAPPDVPLRNEPEFSVSELSALLRQTVEDRFSYVRVRGEVSGFKRPGSGHLYLALKDDQAVMDAVCWRGTASRLSVQPEDGMEVVVTGKLTTYAARSKYQLIIESMELAGQGALLKLLEDRRRRLAEEGLFDTARKRPIPFLPEIVGVVTSPTGAVIRDILHRIDDRFPRRVLMWPVRVQGDGAAAEVAAAIEGFNRLAPDGPVPRPDVLIVARGGGSLEDLWAFNEEIVVRAAAASDIPLISAVGHETDTTLIDYAADRRAPTPTAAAEMAVPVRAELIATVSDRGARLVACLHRAVQDRRMRLEGLARGLPDIDRMLGTNRQRLDDLELRLGNGAANLLERRRQRVETAGAGLKSPKQLLAEARRHLGQRWDSGTLCIKQEMRTQAQRLTALGERLTPQPIRRGIEAGQRSLADLSVRLDACANRRRTEAARDLAELGNRLESCSFHRVLERGYAVIRDAGGEVVTSAAAPKPGDTVSLQFADGARDALIGGGSPPSSRPAKPARPGDKRQGRLL